MRQCHDCQNSGGVPPAISGVQLYPSGWSSHRPAALDAESSGTETKGNSKRRPVTPRMHNRALSWLHDTWAWGSQCPVISTSWDEPLPTHITNFTCFFDDDDGNSAMHESPYHHTTTTSNPYNPATRQTKVTRSSIYVNRLQSLTQDADSDIQLCSGKKRRLQLWPQRQHCRTLQQRPQHRLPRRPKQR